MTNVSFWRWRVRWYTLTLASVDRGALWQQPENKPSKLSASETYQEKWEANGLGAGWRPPSSRAHEWKEISIRDTVRVRNRTKVRNGLVLRKGRIKDGLEAWRGAQKLGKSQGWRPQGWDTFQGYLIVSHIENSFHSPTTSSKCPALWQNWGREGEGEEEKCFSGYLKTRHFEL